MWSGNPRLSHNSRRWSWLRIALALALLMPIPAAPAGGQGPDVEPQLVHIISVTKCGDADWPVTIEVWNVGAAGGEAYAEAVLRGQNCVNGLLEDSAVEGMLGVFTGGPDGTITFSLCTRDADPATCPTLELQFINEGRNLAYQGTLTGYIVQNPEAFDAWRVEPVSAESIFETYGIRVEDSWGDDGHGQKAWSQQELVWLNDVLKELPRGLLKQMALTRIVRNGVKVDSDGNPLPSHSGTYYACGSPPDKDCTAASGAIRIFDNALNPTADFADSAAKFKHVILHELTHALQYYKDASEIYRDAYDSPLMWNYTDATRNITNIYHPDFETMGNGWMMGQYPNQPPAWFLWQPEAANQPPTAYGTTNPKEDMCDSVAMYVYNPDRLKASSIQRYNFIRDHLFGGVEYVNGAQKKP